MLFVFKQVLFLMVDCKEYSFLVKEDVQILHGDNFGGQSNFDQMRIQVFTNKNWIPRCSGLQRPNNYT